MEAIRVRSSKQHNSWERGRIEAHAYTYGGSSPRVGRRYFTEANRVKWFRKDRIIRVLVEQSEHTPTVARLFIFFHPRPLSSAFYLAHRCLSDRTPDTIFPLSSLSIPRTIIPRFISHRERKPVLLPFIGHTDEAQSFQRDTIYYYMLRFVHSLRNPDSYHSSRV